MTKADKSASRQITDSSSASRWPSRVLALSTLALLFAFSIRQVGSADIGFHLKAGNYILGTHHWPRNDTFTYTLNDRPYVDTSWGYQVLVAMAERAAGSAGIVVFHVLLLLGIFITLWRTTSLLGVSPAVRAVMFAVAVIACEMRYETRPEILSLLYLALLSHLLTRRLLGLPTRLWLLPVIQLLWANSHSFFVLGWATMVVFLVGDTLARRRLDLSLAEWCAAAIAICIFNPYGLTGITFPFSLLTRFDRFNVFSSTIGELCSPYSLRLSRQMPFYPGWPIWTFRAYALISFVACLRLVWERRIWALLVWLLFFAATFRMLRNMPLLVVSTLPATVYAISQAARTVRLSGRKAARAATLALCIVVVAALAARTVTNAYYIDDRRPQRFGLSWNNLDLPVNAADYIKRVGLSGGMFNHLNFGGYLMWALPQPVFIDGRLEVVGEAFYERFLEFQKDTKSLDAVSFERLTREFKVEWFIVPFQYAPNLTMRLGSDKNWRLTYFDHNAAVFVRNQPGWERYAEIPQRIAQPNWMNRVRSLPGLGGPTRRAWWANWLMGVVRTPAYLREVYSQGLFCHLLGEYDEAGSRFAQSIQASEGAYYEIYMNLASSLLRKGRQDDAAACYRIVLEDDPDNALARQRATSPP